MALNTLLKQDLVDNKKEINTMSVKEFRQKGFLRELNRQFLHPLGLAISVHIDNKGNETFGNIWDYTHDPEGLLFNGLYTEEIKNQFLEMEKIRKSKAKVRKKKYGYVIQPYTDFASSPRPLENIRKFTSRKNVKKAKVLMDSAEKSTEKSI